MISYSQDASLLRKGKILSVGFIDRIRISLNVPSRNQSLGTGKCLSSKQKDLNLAPRTYIFRKVMGMSS